MGRGVGGVAGMVQGEGRASKFENAVSRYKQGRCPECGKGQGDPKGLEYRERSQDLFCHGCKKRWPIEVDLAALRDDLSLLEPIQLELTPAEIPLSPVPDLPIPPAPSGHRLFGLRRLGRLLQRFPLR